MRLINIGCSFSYGNRIAEFEKFADEHVSPAGLVAKHLGIPELNLASPGLSLDGVLRRLYTHEFNEDDIFLIGLPPNCRVQSVDHKPRNQNKIRGYFKKPTEYRQHAFNGGPKRAEDWFVTRRWDNDYGAKIHVPETLTYWSFYNILLIQTALQGRKHYLYNSVHGHMQLETEHVEIARLRDKISLDNYYMPLSGMQDEVLTNREYQISRDDTHPNHLYYKLWVEGFIDWMNSDAESLS